MQFVGQQYNYELYVEAHLNKISSEGGFEQEKSKKI